MLSTVLLRTPKIGSYHRLVATSASVMSFYSFSAARGDGAEQPMEEFRGKVVYATNVASK